MAISLYILSEGSVAANYGIGTFLREMVDFFQDKREFVITMIEFQSNVVAEFTVENMGAYSSIKIPAVRISGVERDSNRYYSNAWSLIKTQIEPTRNMLFHFNYYQEFPLIRMIRNDFPDSRICFTIHYQMWALQLKGNVRLFREILHKSDEEITTDEKDILIEYRNEKRLLDAVDAVICMSQYTFDLLLEDYGVRESKLVLIYNGLHDMYTPITPKQRLCLRRKMHFADDEKIILFVGRLSPEKGVDYLIEAFKLLLKKIKCQLVIVGDGDISYCLKLCAGVWKRVTFTGRIEKKCLYDFYKVADIGIMPSFHEQCSYVAIEMLMFNLPLIVSTSTGLCETLVDDKSKIHIIEKEKESTISVKNLSMLIMERLRCHPIDGRKRFLEEYNLPIMGNKYLSLYKSLFHQNNDKFA